MPNYTDIAQKGAYSSHSIYTPQDVAHIVSYAGAVRSGLFLPFRRFYLIHPAARNRRSRRMSFFFFFSTVETNVMMHTQEIDTPGHTSAISKAHPEHIACAEATPWATYANEPPAGQLRLASPATINFTVGLLSAVAEMFPSALFSTGGDEINAQCYADDAQTQSDLDGRTLEQALDAFTLATHGALEKLGKTPVVWQGAAYMPMFLICKGLKTFVWG